MRRWRRDEVAEFVERGEAEAVCRTLFAYVALLVRSQPKPAHRRGAEPFPSVVGRDCDPRTGCPRAGDLVASDGDGVRPAAVAGVAERAMLVDSDRRRLRRFVRLLGWAIGGQVTGSPQHLRHLMLR